MSLILLLALAAFLCAILNAIGKCPLWVSVIFLCIIALLSPGALTLR